MKLRRKGKACQVVCLWVQMVAPLIENLTRVYLARLAEQVERYEEMVQFVDKLVLNFTSAGELTKEKLWKNKERVHLVKVYRGKVKNERLQICGGILKLLESNLVPSTSTSETKIFYLKMKGDYYQYFAEFKVRDKQKQVAEDIMNSYKAAQGALKEIVLFFPFT
ncbi:hypothetical protein HAX54_007402 [Datura stramonium]|uniref:14-3-3 domain-containing protein n=1 Tax=Datura stramonium TaxID=4076 RepID=A0ABS8TEA9_DATST|nr:hypothetical protein [Datura stramonium]